MNALPVDSGLTFAWPERERFPYLLFACVFLSLVIHAATFYVFQVTYPQRVTIPPPPPLVSLLTPSSPENEALLRWIAAEDPALMASARSVLPPGLLTVPYRPSFLTIRTRTLGSLEAPAAVPFSPPRGPLSVIGTAAPRPAPETAAPLPMRTTVNLSSTLAERPVKPPTFHWTQRSGKALQPLSALIGVTDHGEVRFTFIQRSSGAGGIDTEALRQLRELRFAPGGAALTWGIATVDFGAEAYATAPAELRSRKLK